MSVEIVSYNILAPETAHWCVGHCPPEALDSKSRLARIFAKLAAPVSRGAIVALQEVSDEWASQIRAWFSDHGYRLCASQYSKLGVLIAWPALKFALRSSCALAPARAICGKPTGPDAKSWAGAKFRRNTVLCAHLETASDTPPGSLADLVVATYHMPCDFRHPKQMVIHGALVAREVQKFSQEAGAPYVFVGDFNSTPQAPVYKMFAGKPLSSNFVPRDTDGCRFQYPSALCSAYKELNGREPEFTNYTRGDEPFIETLDYIFYAADEWTPTSVMTVPTRRGLKGAGSFPTVEEPSDHVMLGAVLERRA